MPETRIQKLSAFKIMSFLKACKDLNEGTEVHAYIQKHTSLHRNCYIASSLISMYVGYGALTKAQGVLEELPVPLRDVVTWNALIAGYAKHGQGSEALKCFDAMQGEGHSPDAVTFTCVLKACGSLGLIARGEHVHGKIVSLGMLNKNIVLGNSLVDMYGRCGMLEKAQRVFDALPMWDVVTWNALISAYAQHGQGIEALNHFDNMQSEGYSPDAVTFTCALMACGSIGAVARGKQIHNKLTNMGLLENDVVLGNVLVDMYARCSKLGKAQQVFDELSVRVVGTWNALITGLVQQGEGEKALKCFDSMQCEGHSPDAATFVCALKACGSIGAVTKGKQIHDKIINLYTLEKNVALGSALVDMYATCGALAKAQQIFDDLLVRDAVMWTALIAGYTEQGQGEEALKCFDCMQHDGHYPDAVTFTCALKACGSIGAVSRGKQLHERILGLGMLEKNTELGSILVEMYAKCGAIPKVYEVFDELPVRDGVGWTALIAGYAQQGHSQEALNCFDGLLWEDCSPNAVTFSCALNACGSLGVVTKGEQIHDKILGLGILDEYIVLGNSLVDMYSRCGAFAKAQQVFNKLLFQDAVAWTALMTGYAQQGQGEEALNCFERMQSRGVGPDPDTLVCVLNACSHSGLLDHSEILFLRMSDEYGIMPALEHYCCMVNVFGRAGNLDKALAEIMKMSPADHMLWFALLGACCKWGDMKMGRLAFENVVRIDDNNAAAYVCMANICRRVGVEEDTSKNEAMGMANEGCKVPERCWWNDATEKMHSFLVRNKKYVQSKYKYGKLKALNCNRMFFPPLYLRRSCFMDMVKNWPLPMLL